MYVNLFKRGSILKDYPVYCIDLRMIFAEKIKEISQEKKYDLYF